MTIKFNTEFQEGKHKGETPASLILMLQNGGNFDGVDYLLWLRKNRSGKYGGIASTFDAITNALIDSIVFEVPALRQKYPVTVYAKQEAATVIDEYQKQIEREEKERALEEERKAQAAKEHAARYKGQWGSWA
ncbi:hypothetical protein ACN1NW_000481 [Acinetobacter baumannii]|nr:hypothetical protein [Acinetobacter baumannii]ELA7031063.1 hypothetical protein [Acinetobacter baumannii]ELA7118826.1 hypothetical protein [Acinetobacter baumannii]ELB0919776.1 hypothetical protein [Acinetobacter baumannii]ELB0965953.1 hypothetical protein [Acinetobacter baumannii]